MRAVFDTNIVVSALIFGGRLAWLRLAWSTKVLVPVICRQTAAELLRALHYPKFQLSALDRAALLEDYLPHAEIVVMHDQVAVLPIECRDRSDTTFLSLAMTAAVPLVTGDMDLAVLRGMTGIDVLSVADLRIRVP